MKFYYIFFYKLFRLFKSTANEGWEDWKALVALCLITVLLLVQGYVYFLVFFPELSFDIPYPQPTLFLISFALCSMHYYLTLHKEKWKAYIDVYNSFSKMQKITSSLLMFFFLCLIVCGLFFSFYKLSQVNWSVYRK